MLELRLRVRELRLSQTCCCVSGLHLLLRAGKLLLSRIEGCLDLDKRQFDRLDPGLLQRAPERRGAEQEQADQAEDGEADGRFPKQEDEALRSLARRPGTG